MRGISNRLCDAVVQAEREATEAHAAWSRAQGRGRDAAGPASVAAAPEQPGRSGRAVDLGKLLDISKLSLQDMDLGGMVTPELLAGFSAEEREQFDSLRATTLRHLHEAAGTAFGPVLEGLERLRAQASEAKSRATSGKRTRVDEAGTARASGGPTGEGSGQSSPRNAGSGMEVEWGRSWVSSWRWSA